MSDLISESGTDGGVPAPSDAESREMLALVMEAMRDAARPKDKPVRTKHGLIGYELEAPAKVVVPRTTPLVNMIPRREGTGADIVHWKAITGVDYERKQDREKDGPTVLVVALQAAFTVVKDGRTVKTWGRARGTGGALDGDFRATHIARSLWDLKHREEAHVIREVLRQAKENATIPDGSRSGAQVGMPASENHALALADLDDLLQRGSLNAAADPDFVVLHPKRLPELTALCVQAGEATYAEVDVPQGEPNVEVVVWLSGQSTPTTARMFAPPTPENVHVTHYRNRYTGKAMPVVVDRFCPEDTIIALPMSIPFPTPDVTSAIEIETNQEYFGVDYAITNEDYAFGVYVDEIVKVYHLGGLCVLHGIAPAA